MKILLLEDDMILSEIVEEFLLDLGYDVHVCYEGLEALKAIEKRKFDLLLLDVGVPNLNGFELLEYLREIKINIPTIFITSLNALSDLERGFTLGCDDYIKKPFELKELKLRIEKTQRVHHIHQETTQELLPGYRYNFASKSILHQGKEYFLPQKESLILEYFIKNKNRIISLDEIIANIWRFDETPSYATLRTYIKNLRKILPKESIRTLKGVGYKFEI